MVKKSLRKLAIASVFSGKYEFDLKHLKQSILAAIIANFIVGKLIASRPYKNLVITKIELNPDYKDFLNINVYWDIQINTTLLYMRGKNVAHDIENMLDGLATVDFSEQGMQGQNYSNFDIKWIK